MLNFEIIDRKFYPHKIIFQENDNPEWSDGQLIIDDIYTNIWIDDYAYYGKEEAYLEYIIENIQNYLKEKENEQKLQTS